MRLIDVDALLADIAHGIENGGCVNHERDIMDSIRYAPAVDAVAVVRCKDCKNSSRVASDSTGRMRHCWRGRGRNNGDGFSWVHRDGYCDDGERKEGKHGTD